jgi:hypothetical protein
VAAVVWLAVLASGCLLSPPIEPYDEPNLGPRIQPLLPDQRSAVQDVSREYLEKNEGVVALSANLYDPNDEPELFYLFLSDVRGDLFDSRNPMQYRDGDEYFFGQVEIDLDPCSDVVTVPGTETVTLYVSDRGFYTTSSDPTEIVEVDGAIMVAYSWTLKYEAGLCDAASN